MELHELESGSRRRAEDLIDWSMARANLEQSDRKVAAVSTAGLYLLVYVYTHTAAMKKNHNCTTL